MLGVDFLGNQPLALPKKFPSKDCDGCCAISDLLVLGFADFDQNFGSRVIDVHGLEDCSTVIGDSDVLLRRSSSADWLEDFIHAFGAESCLD